VAEDIRLIKKYLSLDLEHIEKSIYVVASKYLFFNERGKLMSQKFNFKYEYIYNARFLMELKYVVGNKKKLRSF